MLVYEYGDATVQNKKNIFEYKIDRGGSIGLP